MARRKDGNGKVFVNTREGKNEPLEFFVGDQLLDLVPPGVMLGVKMMGEGEICHLKLASRYAYPSGHPGYGLEADQDIECEVELLRLLDYHKDPPDASPAEALVLVRKYKTRGNEFFTWGEEYYPKALQCYKEAIRYADPVLVEEAKPETPPLQRSPEFERTADEVSKERVSCFNNIATVFEKQGKLKESKEATISVLLTEPDNLKALVRAARIATASGEHQEATLAITRALELDPKNAAARAIFLELKAKIEDAKQKERERYGGFLKPVAHVPSSPIVAKTEDENVSVPPVVVPIEKEEVLAAPQTRPPRLRPRLNSPHEMKVRVLDVITRLCILLAPTVVLAACWLVWVILRLADVVREETYSSSSLN